MLSSTARWEILLDPSIKLLNRFVSLINQHSHKKISINKLGNYDFFSDLSEKNPPEFLGKSRTN